MLHGQMLECLSKTFGGRCIQVERQMQCPTVCDADNEWQFHTDAVHVEHATASGGQCRSARDERPPPPRDQRQWLAADHNLQPSRGTASSPGNGEHVGGSPRRSRCAPPGSPCASTRPSGCSGPPCRPAPARNAPRSAPIRPTRHRYVGSPRRPPLRSRPRCGQSRLSPPLAAPPLLRLNRRWR